MAEITSDSAAEWEKPLDFPIVWAALMETRSNVDRMSDRFDSMIESVKDLSKGIKDLTAEGKQTTANVNALTKRVDETTANVNALGERVDETTANVNALTERVDETTASVKALGERVDETTANVNALTKRVDETTASVKAVSEKVDRTTENVNALTERVNSVTKNVGGLNQSMGDLIETLFAPCLGEKFNAYHYDLKRIFHRVLIYDDSNRLRSDIDILLSNTTVCMAVEVKRWLEKTDQVDQFIKRMSLIRQYPPAEVKGKKLLGAIVGAVVMPEIREYAELNGFFVLELTGENVRLLEPPEGFQPKEW
ncbi:MAG: hypothetical protein LBG87_02645 [Spirochaetaceae bacterium]|jgi:uncharacterized protein YoxC|nr:hypothetical protein [Spirochaetaceae bacterium]